MKQKEFIKKVVGKIQGDKNVVGLAVAGSFITNEIDEFSDVDLILVTVDKVAPDVKKMVDYAKSFGSYLNGFTGEHVGERRVLICLYDKPLLHVDIKFLTLDEFEKRIEDPIILYDPNKALEKVISSTKSECPKLDFQWIEDRFWIWIHYALLKIGRGELIEAYDFLGFIRMVVLGPLLHIKNGNSPRGVRKVETQIDISDFNHLKLTLPNYTRQSLLTSLKNSIDLYKSLRLFLFQKDTVLQSETEKKVMEYFNEIETKKISNQEN